MDNGKAQESGTQPETGSDGRESLPATDHRALKAESFKPHVGTEFTLRNAWNVEGNAVSFPLTLVEATPLQLSPNDGRAQGKSGDVRTDPFSLVFAGPADMQLQQGTYALDHEAFDEGLSLFLVPIGPGAEGLQYESTIS